MVGCLICISKRLGETWCKELKSLQSWACTNPKPLWHGFTKSTSLESFKTDCSNILLKGIGWVVDPYENLSFLDFAKYWSSQPLLITYTDPAMRMALSVMQIWSTTGAVSNSALIKLLLSGFSLSFLLYNSSVPRAATSRIFVRLNPLSRMKSSQS